MTDCLMIFAKAPVPGRCKTRLKLDEAHAMALHRAFVEDVINNSTGDWSQEIWSDDASHPFFNQFNLPVRQQVGRTLGDRLAHAFAQTLVDYHRVVVIGTDAPSLPNAYLEEGFRALESYDAVVGPSCDGGYYGLGLVKRCDAVFDASIPWGEDGVCIRTLKILKSHKINTQVLPFWFDVDRPEDLALLQVLSEGELHPKTTMVLERLVQSGVEL
jgi:rSAM/selenodomain-associated transferase 1